MADIRGSVIQQGEAVVLSDVNRFFNLLAEALKKDKGVALTIKESYISKYEAVNQLRAIVKDKTNNPPADVKPLLDPSKGINEIAEKDEDFKKLEDYVVSLKPADFEPALKSNYKSIAGVDVTQYPNKPKQDPRRTARLVIVTQPEVILKPEIFAWLVNNSMLYGFVLYGLDGLYYLGPDYIKDRVKKASDGSAALKLIVTRFIKPGTSIQLTTTSQKVIDNKLPELVPAMFSDPGDLEVLPAGSGKTNDGQPLDLVVVDGLPVLRPVALAYLAMQKAAKSAGISLSLSSGYRPQFGPSIKAVSSKGRTINLTSQVSLRSETKRWIGRSKFSGTDQEFIMNAPSNYFKPQTARPGRSEHGNGIAIDIHTGGRADFIPLQPAIYTWLVKNSYKYGFIRTVGSEEWHWEYRPTEATKGPYAKLAGTNANRFYADLGLTVGSFPV